MKTPLETLAQRARAGDETALAELIGALKDDVYALAFRMLGLRHEAEDAAQEVLIRIITHLGSFRGESAFRTWAMRITCNHVLNTKRGAREQIASFETIDHLLAAGERSEGPPAGLNEPELKILAEEVRLSCTEAMVLSLDRDQRIAYVLSDVFQLPSDEAAAILEIAPSAFRKRLQRARERLTSWMSSRCGLVDSKNLCRCMRQVPAAMGFGVVSLSSLQYAGHPSRSRTLPQRPEWLSREIDAIETFADVLCDHPDYAAPDSVAARVKEILNSGRYRLFDN